MRKVSHFLIELGIIKRRDRNQWSIENESLWKTYRQMMLWSWEETKSNAPQFLNANSLVY